MCLLVISCVSFSMFSFEFATVTWKLFLSLRSLILVMWYFEFWCLSRPTSDNCYSRFLWKGFSYLSPYRYHNTFFFFSSFLLTTGILPSTLARNASFFPLAAIPNPTTLHNRELVPKPLRGVHRKSKLEKD